MMKPWHALGAWAMVVTLGCASGEDDGSPACASATLLLAFPERNDEWRTLLFACNAEQGDVADLKIWTSPYPFDEPLLFVSVPSAPDMSSEGHTQDLEGPIPGSCTEGIEVDVTRDDRNPGVLVATMQAITYDGPEDACDLHFEPMEDAP